MMIFQIMRFNMGDKKFNTKHQQTLSGNRITEGGKRQFVSLKKHKAESAYMNVSNAVQFHVTPVRSWLQAKV